MNGGLLIYVMSAHTLVNVCLVYLCACVLLCMNMNDVCLRAGTGLYACVQCAFACVYVRAYLCVFLL